MARPTSNDPVIMKTVGINTRFLTEFLEFNDNYPQEQKISLSDALKRGMRSMISERADPLSNDWFPIQAKEKIRYLAEKINELNKEVTTWQHKYHEHMKLHDLAKKMEDERNPKEFTVT